MKKPRILIMGEFSGRVRDAFIQQGVDATSCDFRPTEREGPHYQGDVRDIIDDRWDAMIAFPDCTYLCVSGLHHNKADPERAAKTEKALAFVEFLLNADIPQIALENPIGCISTRIRKPEQIIQPYNFEEDASKATCLWLKNLPRLEPTGYFPPRIVDGKQRWGNQTDSGQNKLTPSEDRAKIRSLTYQGIADAMAAQWSMFL